MYKYPIIVFEGIEASGKSTNLNNASKYLKKIKRKFIKIREPGGTIFSEKIRKLILNNKYAISNTEELLPFNPKVYFPIKKDDMRIKIHDIKKVDKK